MNRIRESIVNYRPIGLCAGGLMWLIWLVSSILGPGNLDLNGQVIGTDHTAFHTAAVLLRQGRGDVLFDYPDLFDFQQEQDAITGKPGFLDPYRNPPFYALPYLITAPLPYLVSFGIWAAIGLLCLTLALWLVRGRRIGWPLLWSLSFYPAFAAVSFGQNTLLSIGMYALVYRSIVSERRFLAGLSASLLLYKPQLLMGLGIWWLLGIRKYWQCLAGLTVGGCILLGISLTIVPEESRTWVERLPDIAKYDKFEFYNLHNPRGFGALLTGSKAIGNAVGMLGLLLGVAWLTRFWICHRDDPKLMFAAALMTTLWASPHTMTYEWAIAILPALVLWDRRPDLRESWTVLFALAWIVLFLSTPITKAQLRVMGVAIQLSVPILAIVIWRIDRSLASSNR